MPGVRVHDRNAAGFFIQPVHGQFLQAQIKGEGYFMSGPWVFKHSLLQSAPSDIDFILGQPFNSAHTVFKHEFDALFTHSVPQSQLRVLG